MRVGLINLLAGRISYNDAAESGLKRLVESDRDFAGCGCDSTAGWRYGALEFAMCERGCDARKKQSKGRNGTDSGSFEDHERGGKVAPRTSLV